MGLTKVKKGIIVFICKIIGIVIIIVFISVFIIKIAKKLDSSLKRKDVAIIRNFTGRTVVFSLYNKEDKDIADLIIKGEKKGYFIKFIQVDRGTYHIIFKKEEK